MVYISHTFSSPVLYDYCCILIEINFQIVFKAPVNYISTLAQMMHDVDQSKSHYLNQCFFSLQPIDAALMGLLTDT